MLPAQIPWIAFLSCHLLGWRIETQVAAIVVGAVVGVSISALWISNIVRPVRNARKRLRALVDAYHLVPPEVSHQPDDEAILVSADRSIFELKEAGLVDPLTGVGNRRAGEQHLQQDLARASRESIPLSLAFFDLDKLKAVNDRHGHMAGDECLSYLASIIRRHVREGDWVARWGGDEFLLALWNADKSRAQTVCDRVLAALRCAPASTSHGFCPLTASVGIAEYESGQTAEALLNNADEALLQSKREGRDRLSVFEWR